MSAGQAAAGDFSKESQLGEIGVSEDVLVNALLAGEAAAARCTRNHPPIAGGFYRFCEIVKSLADQLVPEGWARRDYKNFSTVVRGDGRVAIAVASADDGAGDLGSEVTTRSPKGAATYEAVESNLSLPLDESYVQENERGASEARTWFLLHSRRGGQLFAELSMPQSILAGYVIQWSPRIPLTPIALDVSGLEVSETEPPVNPEIAVRRRDAS